MNEICLKNSRLEAVITPQGAQLLSLRLDGVERLWQGDPAIWDEHAPVLFPIVGRLQGGQYEHNGKTYDLSCHGFAKESRFCVAEQSGEHVRLSLTPDEKIRKQYPFDFVFEVEYTLNENQLTIRFTVRNTGDQPMYYSFGGHPGFRVPPEDGTRFEDWYLKFAEGETLTEATLDGLFMSGKTRPFAKAKGNIVPLAHGLFDDDAFILSGLKNKTFELCSDRSSHRIVADCSDFEDIAFWQATNTDAEYLCIEPWNGLPSKAGDPEILSRKYKIRSLAPGNTDTAAAIFTLD